MLLQNTENRSSAGLDTSQSSQISDGFVQLLSGIWEPRNDHLEDLHNDIVKLFGPINKKKSKVKNKMEMHCG